MDGWRSEAVDAVRELLRLRGEAAATSSWKAIGQARSGQKPGWLVIDLRDSSIRPDNLDQLCLSDDRGPDHGPVHPVGEYRFEDGLLYLRPPDGAPDGLRIAWTLRLSTRVLLERLLDGLRQAGDAPLAEALATNRPAGPVLRTHPEPKGMLSAQLDAYHACLSPGLRLVWGPPGAGKTRVLAAAIEELVRRGRRVLLVSTANVAVDNALRPVIEAVGSKKGLVVQVGPAHLPEIAQNRDVQLDTLTEAAAHRIDEQRRRVEARLARLSRIEDQIAERTVALGGYDHKAYLRARARIGRSAEAAARRQQLVDAQALRKRRAAERASAKASVRAADAERDRIAPARALFAEVVTLTERLAELDRAIAAREKAHSTAAARLRALRQNNPGLVGWLRHCLRTREAAAATERERQELVRLAAERIGITASVDRCHASAHPVTERDVVGLAARRVTARKALERATTDERTAVESLTRLRKSLAEFKRDGVATDADREFVAAAERDGLPSEHQWLEQQRAKTKAEGGRGALEDERRRLLDEAHRARRDAEAEVIRKARVVATTLARSRVNRVLAEEQFDVVLVDEAGAAMLAEVLLVLCRAETTAVLFGDFLQLGPVIEDKAQRSKDPAVRRWILSDCFTHTGINKPDDAQAHPSCVVLEHQFRFGSNVRELANNVIYKVLKDADELPGIPANPRTKVVIIDVSDLPDLAEVRTNGGKRGWWPVGVVLSRALAEHHLAQQTDDDTPVGIVTPYTAQRDCTLAALRDKDIVRDVTVGTVHAFQGREFPTVILDLVEDGYGWVGKARDDRGNFARSGLRLFGVGITRVRKHLYVIVNGDAVRAANGGPLAELRALHEGGGAELWSAAALLGVEARRPSTPSVAFAEVAQLLGQWVSVTDISDERTFWAKLEEHLSGARQRVWMWSPWIATRADTVVPLIRRAVERGVDVRVLLRPDRDRLMSKKWAQPRLAELVRSGATVIRVDQEHRKIVVVDDHTVLLGSLNTLSQSPGGKTREVMVTMTGRAFVDRLLKD